MADIVTREKRSSMMRGIRSKNTKPEVELRKLLFRMGFRFRLHRKDLPGKPDIVLPKWKTVIFVHGCFWHRHEGCRLAAIPKTRTEFWQKKFAGNVARDRRNRDLLLSTGWRVAIVWECGMRRAPEEIATNLGLWVSGSNSRKCVLELGV